MKLEVRGRGPLVVKLAGIAGGTGLYREETEAAAEAGFRVARLDTSGDRADDPASGPVTWDSLASDVASGLDRLGGEKAVLWGTSFGCLVALAAAARHPRLVSGLLLCHPPDPGGLPGLHRFLARRAVESADPRLAGRLLLLFGFNLVAGWESLFPKLIPRLSGLVRASLAARTPSSTVVDKLGLLLGPGPGLPPADARIPATIVAGAWDAITPIAGARRLAARIACCELRAMGWSGHYGAYSWPRTYARIVCHELERLSSAAKALRATR